MPAVTTIRKEPSNPPVVKKTVDGYRLRWSATNPTDGARIKMNTKYYRIINPRNKQIYLECSDLDAPKEEKHEVNCEGGTFRSLEDK